MEENKKTTTEAPKTFLDRNASWPLTVLYLAFLVGVWLGQRASVGQLTKGYNSWAYFLISIFVGLIVSFIVYNAGKILFAKIAGYRLLTVRILGMHFNFAFGKLKFTYEIKEFFTLNMTFTPVNEDLHKNPKKIFLGGIIAEAILLVVCLACFFSFSVFNKGQRSTLSDMGWGILFAYCYGFITPLYEIMPLRQDYPTDIYNCMIIKTEEDKIAYNICRVNDKRELTGEDFLVQTFESYDSFYKAHMLYYIYLQNLYESKLEKAFSVLEDMKYYNKYFIDDEKYISSAETVYLKYLIDDAEGARKNFLNIKKDDRKALTNPSLLSIYRTSILVLVDTQYDKEAVLDLIKEMDVLIGSYGENLSKRVLKEKTLFDAAYKKASQMKPELELPTR